MSLLADIADAVVETLAGAPEAFPLAFTPERAWVPTKVVDEMADAQAYVLVVPRAIEDQLASRSDEQLDLRIDVAVQMKLPAVGRDAAADAAADLVEAIRDFLRDMSIGDPRAVCIRVAWPDACSPELWREHGVFSGTLNLTLRTIR